MRVSNVNLLTFQEAQTRIREWLDNYYGNGKEEILCQMLAELSVDGNDFYQVKNGKIEHLRLEET